MTSIICAPSNLGLRPETQREPGAWQAPAVLLESGLERTLDAKSVQWLPRPLYRFDAEPETRIRNGHAIRAFNESLSEAVQEDLRRGHWPLVLGGDCSILLGCLLGARRQGPVGLLHVDGHSDFFHPGNYDVQARLGSAAGMDLALVTGRGEPLLVHWPGIAGPLVADENVAQLGERDALRPEYDSFYGDIKKTRIHRYLIQDMLDDGMARVADRLAHWAASRDVAHYWLHVDLDILTELVFPAVDSPGQPGLNFEQLAELIQLMLRKLPVIGMDVTIYDPSKDPARQHASQIVRCLGTALTHR